MRAHKWIRSGMKLAFLLGFWMFFMGAVSDAEEGAWVDIVEGDEWYYFKGKQEPPAKWNHVGFEKEVGDWQKGPTGLGYGLDRVRTELKDMRGKYEAVYARRDFFLSLADYELLQRGSTGLTLSIVCDGAFRVWLNGVEVIASEDEFLAAADDVFEGLEIDITPFARELVEKGSNVLAIWCANDCLDDDSFLFIPALNMRKGGA
jgi:hypothetical protein